MIGVVLSVLLVVRECVGDLGRSIAAQSQKQNGPSLQYTDHLVVSMVAMADLGKTF